MLGNCCSIDKYWLCRRAVGQAVFDPYRGQILDYPQPQIEYPGGSDVSA
jgi:hypothetical protein